MKNSKMLLSLLLSMMLMISAGALAQTDAAVPAEGEIPNYFTLLDTVDIYGEPFDPAQFADMPIIINIWADWCGPCLSEMPALEILAEEYKDRAMLVGLLAEGVEVTAENTLAVVQDKLDGAQKVYESLAITYPTIVPDEFLYTIMSQTGLKAFPTTWFVNADGYIIHMVEGSMSEDNWRKTFDSVLEFIENQPEVTDAP